MEVGVPNVFPIAPCHLISLAQITPLVTYISSPKEKTTIHICCECPKFNHNFFCDGPINDAHGKSNFGSPGQLITNMNHSILSTNLCNHKPLLTQKLLGKHSNKIIPLGKKAPPSFSLIWPGISHTPILEIGSWRGRGWAMGVVVGGRGRAKL
jgi:hypothetical protein